MGEESAQGQATKTLPVDAGGRDQRRFAHLIEVATALPLIGAFTVLSWLPVEWASAITGRIVQIIALFTQRHRRAEAALKRHLPELSNKERRRILRAMWDNVGRIFGELPHIDRILDDPDRFSFDGLQQVMHGIAEDCGVVTVTGHFGNWELSPAPSYHLRRRQVSFYRSIKNPLLDAYVRRQRERISTGELVAKSDRSMRRAMEALARGEFIGLMADQREKRGIDVPFLGVDAPTSHAPALLTLRYDAPLLAGIVVRERGVRFRMICRRITFRRTGDREADVRSLTREINDVFSDWVREYPEQWLWSHRRW